MEKIVETILANLPVGLLVLESNGTIEVASKATCDIIGCPSQGFVGKKWGDLFLDDDQNLEFAGVVFDAIQKKTSAIETVTPYLTASGETKYLSVISSVLREDDKLSEIVVIIEDLTELKRMHEREKAILEQNHRLATQRANSLDAFARSVAHQIRNPLMTIAGFTRIMERKMNEESREPLEAIKDESRRLETMVNAVADYSAISLDNIAPVNLRQIIEDAKQSIEHRPAVESKTIEWQTECPDMNITVDHTHMARALSEVLLNSAEFGESPMSVSINAREQYPNIVITITDHGPGFAEDSLTMAFDPFFTTKPVGAGMGLTRAKRILNEHQGAIAIENLPEGGARVSVSLPMEPY